MLVPDGVMASRLTTGPKIRGYNPGLGLTIFKGDKNPLHLFFRRERKAIGPCRKVLLHVKNPFEV
jgi:hypothetical protein